LTVKGQPIVFAQYRFHWVGVTNGSIFEKGDVHNGNVVEDRGSSANHYLQQLELRLFAPIHNGIGLGADLFEFLRKSRYRSPLLPDQAHRHPEARLYLAWPIWGPAIGPFARAAPLSPPPHRPSVPRLDRSARTDALRPRRRRPRV